MNFKDRICMLLATGGGLGYIPVASGTFGSLPGIVIAYALSNLPMPLALGAIIALTALAVWSSDQVEKRLGQKDPGCIVIDEIVGMTVTLLWLPFNAVNAVCGFFIFRILDIVKPFPARTLERKLRGGAGVVMDDVAAGIYANLLLRLALLIAERL